MNTTTRTGQNSSHALAIAQVILWGFNKHYRLFRELTRGAQQRFENEQWQAIQQAARERIEYYDHRVNETAERLENEFQTDKLHESVWQQVKFQYVNLLVDHKQPECAETFFNSVCSKILHRTYFNNAYIFVRPTISTEHIDSDPPAYRSYYPGGEDSLPVLHRLFADYDFECPFENLERDLVLVIEATERQQSLSGRPFKPEPNYQIQVLRSVFYRNKMAYIIGKIINGYQEQAFAIPVRHNTSHQLVIDTIIFDSIYLHWIFSYARAYFMVDTEVPAAYVQFLRTIVPGRSKSELYTMLGLQKHGKALFYRDYLQHLRHSTDLFDIAPGIKGLVMLVFALPSFGFVFKVIRDVIPAPKEIDRAGVKAKYQLVKMHDRVGRMADTLEYSDVAFPKNRFAPALIEELKKLAPSVYVEEGNQIVIRHVYIERRMTPLNLYLQSAGPEDFRHALYEYGMALKQLAAANIFPGDMLYKNFGVTRNNRVVFYDYDEIEYMTACNFRRVPQPRNEEDEMSGEPWYTVGPHDVFPEEWQTFLLGDPKIRATMLELHPDIFTPEYWQSQKERIEGGHFEDVFPYPEEIRFHQTSG